jgi:LysR family hydrogen peroxide-inducible transcriptional activator
VIPELKRVYPDLKLYVREELPNILPAALDEGRHDVVITLLPVRGGDLVSRPLFRESLHLAVAANHPLADRKAVRRSDLKGIDVLALGPGHQLHDAVLALCEEFGARLRYEYEGTSLDTLREMVAMGLGVTFLPGLYVQSVVARDGSIKTLELEDRAVFRTVGLVWRSTSARQDSYAKLADLLRSVLEREFQNLAMLP